MAYLTNGCRPFYKFFIPTQKKEVFMDLDPRCRDKVLLLLEKGVDIPNPLSIHIGREVDPGRISGSGVRIEPGCRIYGRETVLCAGARLGREGPATLENCQLGPNVEFKAGYGRESTFLHGASMGLGAQVREGCLLEEQASGAHCVGLKQTILFPFVTLGSLINFCDCLMAGGTSRRNHSEVGSSYIHFNYTPDGEKTTPTLIGDVSRGVMLNQPPIFLGGQGGIVGPQRIEYGTVLAAGSILRQDVIEENKLVICPAPRGGMTNFTPHVYSGLSRMAEKNIQYLANLTALEQWYEHVRKPFFETEEHGEHLYQGARSRLAMAMAERLKRLRTMSEHMVNSIKDGSADSRASRSKLEFKDNLERIEGLFTDTNATETGAKERDAFLSALDSAGTFRSGAYIESIQALPREVTRQGTQWLNKIVEDYCIKAAAMLPSLKMFRKIIL
jgi:UDP-N-acetylglucosamine/UDP-N-acetylgalactosamine diphosphorylase